MRFLDAEAMRSRVKGFLVPVFQEADQQGNIVLSSLLPDDFQKVVDGYACSNCLAEFWTYTFKCPLCGLQRNLQADIKATPQEWLDHLHERENPSEKAPVVNPLAAGLALPDDLETIPAGKLRNTKKKGH